MPSRRRHWLRLNLRVLALALRGRFLDSADTASGYDRAAPTYDDTWLVHLRPVTDALVARLPELPPGSILDLGCGTGHSTAALAARFTGQAILAADISHEMLERARRRLDAPPDPAAPHVLLRAADMLDVLRAQAPASVALVFSAWAIGYSHPSRIVASAARALVPGGVLAFVVNRADTLAPLFRAFRRTMAAHPHLVRLAAIPRFPHSIAQVRRWLRRAGLEPSWVEDGSAPIPHPETGGQETLDWLLATGVLAGVDRLLPLRERGPAADTLAEELAHAPGPLHHRYIALVASRS